MAHLRIHHHARPAPHWAAKGLKAARRFERRMEYHWAFVSYALLSIAVAAYVVAVLVSIP